MHTTISLTLALLLSACAAKVPPEKTAPGDPAYQRIVALKDIDGRTVGPPDPGTEATVLVVFASWCGHCKKELRYLGELRQQEPSVRILGLNAYEDWGDKSNPDKLRRYIDDSAPWLRVVPVEKDILDLFGGVPKIPSIFFYDRAGNMVTGFNRKATGIPSHQQIKDAVERAKNSAS